MRLLVEILEQAVYTSLMDQNTTYAAPKRKKQRRHEEITAGSWMQEQVGASLYEAWLGNPYRESMDIAEKGAVTPRDVLETMATSQVNGPNGEAMTVLEAIIMGMMQRALSGDKFSAEKVYDELQHHGVKKVAVGVTDLSPAAQYVLQRAGVVLPGDDNAQALPTIEAKPAPQQTAVDEEKFFEGIE